MSAINIPLCNADVNMDTPSLPVPVLDTFPDWLEVLTERNQLEVDLKKVSRNCLVAHGCQCEEWRDCPSHPQYCKGWMK